MPIIHHHFEQRDGEKNCRWCSLERKHWLHFIPDGIFGGKLIHTFREARAHEACEQCGLHKDHCVHDTALISKSTPRENKEPEAKETPFSGLLKISREWPALDNILRQHLWLVHRGLCEKCRSGASADIKWNPDMGTPSKKD